MKMSRERRNDSKQPQMDTDGHRFKEAETIPMDCSVSHQGAAHGRGNLEQGGSVHICVHLCPSVVFFLQTFPGKEKAASVYERSRPYGLDFC
jgi:hypothetical protein